LIEIHNLRAKLGDFILELDKLEVHKGEYFTILGPSGVGKTVLINVIAGIIAPEKGKIIIDGIDVTELPPEKRGIAIVPQDYALFPHMSVYENIAYGLKVRGLPEKVVREKVIAIARILKIDNILNRRPISLSGGERQRVALARALIINPKVILLDEPFASLDPGMRTKARKLLKELHKNLKFTAIHVTHNIIDAITLSKRVGYMEGGRMIFVGSLKEFLKTRYAIPYLEELREAIEALR
jgi:molybdate/tungstate transport system ATP-binding protein